MASMWHYRLFGEDFGPVPEETLQELIQAGTLGDSDEVRSASSSAWSTVANAFAKGATGNSSATMTAVSDAESADETLDWYCRVAGQELGPLSFNDLLRFAENGELTANDEVRFGSSGRWRKTGSIGRLMAALPYQAAEPTPKPVNRSRTTPQTTAVAPPAATPAVSAPAPVVPSYLPAAHELSWFAWIGGVEYGPSSLLQLSEWLKTGQLNQAGMVKFGPMGAWTPPAIVPQTLAQLTVVTAPAATVKPPVPAAPAAQSPPAALPTKKPVEPQKPAPVSNVAATPVVKPVETKPAAPVPAVKPAAEVKPPPESPKPVASTVAATPPSPPASSAPPRAPAPAWQPPKTAPKPAKRTGGGGIDWGFLGPLAEPKNLAIVGGCLVAVALVFVFPYIPMGSGKDKVYLEQLQAILKEYRQLRAKKAPPSEWTAFSEKAKKTGAEIAAAVAPQASRSAPQKQFLLWSSKNRLPEMLQNAQAPYVPAEFDYENNLYEAAKLLKVPMEKPTPPPPPPGSKGTNLNPNIDRGS